MIERFIHHKRLILHYYLVMLFVSILFWWWARYEEMLDGVILAILAVYMLVFPVVIIYTRKYALHIFLFILALITGFYSFYHYSVEEHSVLNALYFTFQLYLLDITDVFTSDGSALLRYPLIVEIARWSAALYTISTLFIAMYRLLEMSILLVYYQIVGNHYVVFGYNENSVTLMEDLRKHKKRVILIAEDISNEAIDELEDLKIVVVNPNENEEQIYTKCGLDRASHVVLFHEKDMDNLNAFMKIEYYFEKKQKQDPTFSLYIHLTKMASRRLFTDLEEGSRHKKRSYPVHIMNLYDLFVEHLFATYPIIQQDQPEESLHLLIIGFGSMGQQIALKALSEIEKQEQETLLITALDKHMNKIKPEWDQQNPNMTSQTALSLQTFDIESETLESIINDQEVPITHIYICLHEDYLDVLAGIELSNTFPKTPIFIEFPKNSIAEKWIQAEVTGERLIYSTGTYDEVLTAEKLIGKS